MPPVGSDTMVCQQVLGSHLCSLGSCCVWGGCQRPPSTHSSTSLGLYGATAGIRSITLFLEMTKARPRARRCRTADPWLGSHTGSSDAARPHLRTRVGWGLGVGVDAGAARAAHSAHTLSSLTQMGARPVPGTHRSDPGVQGGVWPPGQASGIPGPGTRVWPVLAAPRARVSSLR